LVPSKKWRKINFNSELAALVERIIFNRYAIHSKSQNINPNHFKPGVNGQIILSTENKKAGLTRLSIL
jgi:retron-type reverse transcriptase